MERIGKAIVVTIQLVLLTQIGATRTEPPPEHLRGVVTSKGGHPVHSAQVFHSSDRIVALAWMPLAKQVGLWIPLFRGAERIKSDATGKFEIARSRDGFLVAVDRSGYATHSTAAEARQVTMTLKPWARVRGRALAGDEPLDGATIVIASSTVQESRLRYMDKCVTNRAGEFSFARVPAGRYRIARELQAKVDGATELSWSHGTIVEVAEGETKACQIGGHGRDISGTIEGVPENATRMTGALHGIDEEGELLSLDPLLNCYAVLFSEAGEFNARDIPPGRYRMAIVASSGREIRSASKWAEYEFEVPADPRLAPHDLGAIELEFSVPQETGCGPAVEGL